MTGIIFSIFEPVSDRLSNLYQGLNPITIFGPVLKPNAFLDPIVYIKQRNTRGKIDRGNRLIDFDL